ncbi:MAG TPA: hypothetical protein ACFYD4_08550, partial [Candidatus Wunengus sp. YC61]|uniref:hypothetical protein n=1 Tax=Candidatus Wunengus sp. YC61 TaxID=3367698 RepID=UPI004025ED54
VRHFEDQALSGLKPNSDKIVTTPALRLGLVGTRLTRALALMAQQHEVVHVVYCQSLILHICIFIRYATIANTTLKTIR